MNPQRHPPTGDWEETLDRRLKALPDLPAPATLAARVMAAVQARARQPWYRREFSQWSLPCQITGLLVLSLALAALTWAGLHFWQGDLVGQAGGRFEDFLRPLAAVGALLTALAEAATLIIRQIHPLIWGAVGVALLSAYLSVLGFGTLLYRMTVIRRNT